MTDKIKEIIEKHIEWHLYKALYVGILVPLLFEGSRKLVFQDTGVAIVLFATAVILLLPVIFKVNRVFQKLMEVFE